MGLYAKFLALVVGLAVLAGTVAASASVLPLRGSSDGVDAAESIIGAVRKSAPGMLTPIVDYAQLGLQAARCKADTEPTTRAILLGASRGTSSGMLSSPENDVELLASSLESRGVEASQIVGLTGHSVTREGIAKAFIDVIRKSNCGDRVIVHFSGLAQRTDRYLSSNIMSVVRVSLPKAASIGDTIEELSKQKSSVSTSQSSGAEYREMLISRLRYINSTGLVFFVGTHTDYPRTTEVPGKVRGRSSSAGRPFEQDAPAIADVFTAADLSDFVTNVRNRGADVFVFLDAVNAAHAGIATRQAAVFGGSPTWVYETGAAASENLDSKAQVLGARASYAAFYASLDDNNSEAQYGDSEATIYGVFTYRLAVAIQNRAAATVRELAENLDRASQGDRFGRIQHHRVEGSGPDVTVLADSLLVQSQVNPIVITSPNVAFRGPVPIERSIVELGGSVQWSAALVGVQVNGEPALVNPDGTFSAEIELEVGSNTVEIIAYTVDRKAFRRELEFVFDGNVQELVGHGQRYALLIANQQYGQDSGFASLSTPRADVDRLRTILEGKYGFLTKGMVDGATFNLVLYDATGDEIGFALDQLNMIVREEDTVLVYYAGHGFLEEGDGEIRTAFWIPRDAKTGHFNSYFDAERITHAIARMKAKKVVVVSDSCFSGAMTRGNYTPAEKIDDRNRNRVLMGLSKAKTRVLIASGNIEPVPDNEGNGHSVFANAFAEGLNDMAHDAFTARELFDSYVLHPVMSRSRQEPQFKQIYESGHKGGDVVFVRLK